MFHSLKAKKCFKWNLIYQQWGLVYNEFAVTTYTLTA